MHTVNDLLNFELTNAAEKAQDCLGALGNAPVVPLMMDHRTGWLLVWAGRHSQTLISLLYLR